MIAAGRQMGRQRITIEKGVFDELILSSAPIQCTRARARVCLSIWHPYVMIDIAEHNNGSYARRAHRYTAIDSLTAFCMHVVLA